MAVMRTTVEFLNQRRIVVSGIKIAHCQCWIAEKSQKQTVLIQKKTAVQNQMQIVPIRKLIALTRMPVVVRTLKLIADQTKIVLLCYQRVTVLPFRN